MFTGGKIENFAEINGSNREATGSEGWNKLYTCCNAGRFIEAKNKYEKTLMTEYTIIIVKAYLIYHIYGLIFF